jgi:hypothetical protein
VAAGYFLNWRPRRWRLGSQPLGGCDTGSGSVAPSFGQRRDSFVRESGHGPGVFVWYGDTNAWHIPALAITGWLAATVVQVMSVVLVITRYLFPHEP